VTDRPHARDSEQVTAYVAHGVTRRMPDLRAAALQAIRAVALKAPAAIDALRPPSEAANVKHQVLDLASDSPTTRLMSSGSNGRRGPSVTDRAQRWQPLATAPLQIADEGTDLAAFATSYEQGKRLGKGAFGTVFMATCKRSQRKVAVKMLSSGSHAAPADIRQEIMVLRAFASPHIVATIGAYWSADCTEACLVQELMDGGELFAWVRGRATPLSSREIARLSGHLLLGLRHLHEKGVMHRDIKPSNLLLSDRSDDAQLRIGDFGLCALLRGNTCGGGGGTRRRCGDDGDSERDGVARRLNPNATDSDGDGPSGEANSNSVRQRPLSGAESTHIDGGHPEPTSADAPALDPAACVVRHAMAGTPEWMAPEVIMCAEAGAPGYSFACDLWSAGCVIYALLTGREHGPFGRATSRLTGDALLAGIEVEGGSGEEEEDDGTGTVVGRRHRPTLTTLFERILGGHWGAEHVSDYLARDLLSHLLARVPESRYHPADALTHPWVLLTEEDEEGGSAAGDGGSVPCSPNLASEQAAKPVFKLPPTQAPIEWASGGNGPLSRGGAEMGRSCEADSTTPLSIALPMEAAADGIAGGASTWSPQLLARVPPEDHVEVSFVPSSPSPQVQVQPRIQLEQPTQPTDLEQPTHPQPEPPPTPPQSQTKSSPRETPLQAEAAHPGQESALAGLARDVKGCLPRSPHKLLPPSPTLPLAPPSQASPRSSRRPLDFAHPEALVPALQAMMSSSTPTTNASPDHHHRQTISRWSVSSHEMCGTSIAPLRTGANPCPGSSAVDVTTSGMAGTLSGGMAAGQGSTSPNTLPFRPPPASRLSSRLSSGRFTSSCEAPASRAGRRSREIPTPLGCGIQGGSSGIAARTASSPTAFAVAALSRAKTPAIKSGGGRLVAGRRATGGTSLDPFARPATAVTTMPRISVSRDSLSYQTPSPKRSHAVDGGFGVDPHTSLVSPRLPPPECPDALAELLDSMGCKR